MPRYSTTDLTVREIEKAKPGETLWDSKFPGLGLRVSTGGTKTFILKFRLGKVQKKPKLGRFPVMTVPEARARAREVLSQAPSKQDQTPPTEGVQKTLQDMLDFYTTHYAAAKQLDLQTVKDALTVARLYLPKATLARTVASFTYDDIMKLVAEAKRIGERRERERVLAAAAAKRVRRSPASPGGAQVNRLIALLSRLFNLSMRGPGGCVRNPCAEIDLLQIDERIRNFSDAEVASLLRACERYDARGAEFQNGSADVVRLLLYTGARLQEVVAATWSQFELDRAMWNKPSAHTKQNALHRMSLGEDSPALKILTRLKTHTGNSAYVFPSPLLKKGIDRPRSDIKRGWAWISKMAGLEADRPHDLRRTTACFMLEDEVPLTTIGQSLGHTQHKTTLRYAKLKPGAQGDALAKTAKRMAALA